MIFQNVSFGFILKHFLNNDPRLAITFAGVLLLIGAICTLFIKTENKKLSDNSIDNKMGNIDILCVGEVLIDLLDIKKVFLINETRITIEVFRRFSYNVAMNFNKIRFEYCGSYGWR
jgi:hypothetical protein